MSNYTEQERALIKKMTDASGSCWAENCMSEWDTLHYGSKDDPRTGKWCWKHWRVQQDAFLDKSQEPRG